MDKNSGQVWNEIYVNDQHCSYNPTSIEKYTKIIYPFYKLKNDKREKSLNVILRTNTILQKLLNLTLNTTIPNSNYYQVINDIYICNIHNEIVFCFSDSTYTKDVHKHRYMVICRELNYRFPEDVYDELTDDIYVMSDYIVRPKIKYTQEHHYHISDEAWPTILEDINANEQTKAIVNLASNYDDATLAFIQGLGLYILCLNEKELSLINGIVKKSNSMVQWYNNAKDVTIILKKISCKFFDCTKLFEIETLVNRCVDPIDWTKEKIKRTEEFSVVNINEVVVYNIAKDIFTEGRERTVRLKYKRKNYKNFLSFLKNRYEWSTTGNGFVPFRDKKYQVDTKLDLLNDMSIEELSERIANQGAMIVHPSVKHEWGKTRAIYSTDVISYVCFEYIFSDCENVLPIQAAIGSNTKDRMVDSRLLPLNKSKYVYTADFEDFNSQHSLSTIKMIMLAWFDVWKDDMHDDSKIIMDKCLEYIDNTYILFPGDQNYHRNTSSLMSGWRLTSFVNTVANIVYHRFIMNHIKIPDYISYHAGDDIITTFPYYKCRELYEKACKQFNIRLQNSKCNLCSVVEFLRVNYVSGTPTQYLSRACASLVHGRIESKKTNDLHAAVHATRTRYVEYVNRGGKKFDVYNILLSKFSRINNSTFLGVPISYMLYNIPVDQGGVYENDDTISDYDNLYCSKKMRYTKNKNLSTYAIQDYTDMLYDKLKYKNKRFKNKIRNYLTANYLKDRSSISYSYEIKILPREDILNYKQHLRKFKENDDILRSYYYTRKFPMKLQYQFINKEFLDSLFNTNKYFIDRGFDPILTKLF